jgi:hypothetical protein
MIYALCDIQMENDHPQVLEFASEEEAKADFRETVTRTRLRSNIVQRYLFKDADTARRANVSDEYEILIEESLAYKVLDFERGFGFNF